MTPQAGDVFLVEVRDARSETTHEVSVPDRVRASMGCEHVPPEELVKASFGFLLAREPSTSILPRFTLDQIGRYFPEYTREMHARFGGDRG